ncbi:MAG: hypothetical protein ACT4PW_02445 [Acidimicrobiia bacterium]
MLVASLSELPAARSRTVVINVGTDLVATRAVLSATDVVGGPVLVVNCDPTEASRWRFGCLARERQFDLIEAPTLMHGQTIDWLFRGLHDERLLLLDSDAEVRSADFVTWMQRKLDHPLAFGAGFTWGPFMITEEWLAPADSILYMERPWVPCVLFKSSAIDIALAAGRSFAAKFIPNDVAVSRKVSNFLASRWGPPWGTQSVRFSQLPGPVKERMKTMRLDGLRFARRRYSGLKPSMACYDTGGDVYEYLKIDREMLFAGIPMELADGEVHHYSGVTRYALYGRSALDTDPDEVAQEILDRLDHVYGYAWEDGPA